MRKFRYWIVDSRYLSAERDPASQEKFSKGFTLIELVIYMGLLSIMLGVLLTLFGSILDAQFDSQSQAGLIQDERFIDARLVYDLHRAASITTPASLTSPTNQGNMLTITVNGDPESPYTYSLNGTDLVLTSASGSAVLNSVDTKVSNLLFKRIGNATGGGKDTIQILFTLTSTILRHVGPETRTFETTVGLREP